jgi:hypothetical protein
MKSANSDQCAGIIFYGRADQRMVNLGGGKFRCQQFSIKSLLGCMAQLFMRSHVVVVFF